MSILSSLPEDQWEPPQWTRKDRVHYQHIFLSTLLPGLAEVFHLEEHEVQGADIMAARWRRREHPGPRQLDNLHHDHNNRPGRTRTILTYLSRRSGDGDDRQGGTFFPLCPPSARSQLLTQLLSEKMALGDLCVTSEVIGAGPSFVLPRDDEEILTQAEELLQERAAGTYIVPQQGTTVTFTHPMDPQAWHGAVHTNEQTWQFKLQLFLK